MTTMTRPGDPAVNAIIGGLELLAVTNQGGVFQVRETRGFTTVGRIVGDFVDGVWTVLDVRGRRVLSASTLRDAAVEFDRRLP